MIEIVPYDASLREDCALILGSLPEWFGIPEANRDYIQSLDRLTTFVARRGGQVAGFTALEQHFPESIENHVLAVRPDMHRRGVGWALLAHAEAWARARDIQMFHVKTLGPSEVYEPYERTRSFYFAFGFRPLFETTALWGPENPALIMAKSIQPKQPGQGTG